MRSLGTELRALTSSFSPEIRLTLTSRDGLTTYVHCSDDIISMSSIEWEMPFTGGLGRPSLYDIDISLSLSDIKTRLADYNRAEVSLRIDVAGQNFHPHLGRVRKIRRDSFDPNKFSLTIIDRILDDNPFLPVETISDSYTGTHLEEIGPEDGYPLYYGRHHRPFYFTAIDCDINELFGPRNVSSENHVNSLWFNSDFEEGDDTNRNHVIMLTAFWNQESGSTNLTNSTYPFDLLDLGALDTRLWKFNGAFIPHSETNVNTPGRIYTTDHGYTKMQADTHEIGVSDEYYGRPVMEENIDIFLSTGIQLHATTNIAFSPGESFQARLNTLSGDGNFSELLILEVNNQNLDLSFTDIASNAGRFAFSNNRRTYIRLLATGDSATPPTPFRTFTLSAHMSGRLYSSSYKKFSIFSPVINSEAISNIGSASIFSYSTFENPIGILDDVFSHHTSTPYVQSQSSASQLTLSNSFIPQTGGGDLKVMGLQCFFATRRPISKIIDEFGKIGAFNAWIGDSGMVNYRVYQESANATTDRTITNRDIEIGTFNLTESPIGGHLGDHEIFDKISVKFGFNYQRRQYERSARAYPANNKMCNSVNAAGIINDFKFETEYITDPDVASYFLGNLVRLYAQGKETVEFSGGANLFDIELGDVLKVQNPIIVGSESLYQVIKVSMNPVKGSMRISATELIANLS